MSTHDCNEHLDAPLDPPDRYPHRECASCERLHDPADGRTCGDCGDEPWICDDCAEAHRAERHAPEDDGPPAAKVVREIQRENPHVFTGLFERIFPSLSAKEPGAGDSAPSPNPSA